MNEKFIKEVSESLLLNFSGEMSAQFWTDKLVLSQGNVRRIDFESAVFAAVNHIMPIAHRYGLRVVGEGGGIRVNQDGDFVLVFPIEGSKPASVFPDVRKAKNKNRI